MDDLILTINQLQDALTLLGSDPLNLPQICVVGAQSSGKSSVLENIVGKDFLPRGTGIVTRRPLVIQLIRSPVDRDYGEFLHRKGEKFYDFNAVRAEIARYTEEETGTNCGISDKPINLKIVSSSCLNLTLVDLPGITRVPIGDQPKDIEHLIRAMVLRYVQPSNAIVLAVTAANTDLTNSDALQIAREVDADGVRTVGVITKVDIMDRGTNAMQMLSNKVVPLRLGYIAVVNRSQADIDGNKTIKSQWEAEKTYFQRSPEYSAIAARCGTEFLAKSLRTILLEHIRTALPGIASKITTFVQVKKTELTEAESLCDSTARQRVVLRMLTSYSERFRGLMEGTYEGISSSALHGGARIAAIFDELFPRSIMGVNPLEQITDAELRTTMRNCIGMQSSLFISDHSFHLLVKQAVRRLLDPVLKCVKMVYDEMLAMAMSLGPTDHSSRYLPLANKTHTVVQVMLSEHLQPTLELATTLVDMETSRINARHPDFIGSTMAMTSLMAEVASDLGLAGTTAPNRQPVRPAPTLPPPPPPASAYPTATASSATPAGTGAGAGPAEKGSAGTGAAPSPATGSESPPVPRRRGTQRHGAVMDAAPDDLTEREKIETEVIRRLLQSYFNVVRKKIIDSVPKAITLRLIHKSVHDIHDVLVGELYRDDVLGVLFAEDDESKAARVRLREVIGLMEQTLSLIGSINLRASTM